MSWKQQVRKFETTFDYATNDQWQKTESLKRSIATFCTRQPNSGLSVELVDEILDWKLRKQRRRTEAHRKSLTKALWTSVINCAFSVQHKDPDVSAAVKVGVLSSLPGVGVGVATAILALTFPKTHGVVDYRVWEIIFQEEKQSFTAKDYVTYLQALRPFAQETGWSVQKADFMTWSYYDEQSSA